MFIKCFCLIVLDEGGKWRNGGLSFIGTIQVTLQVTAISKAFPVYKQMGRENRSSPP